MNLTQQISSKCGGCHIWKLPKFTHNTAQYLVHGFVAGWLNKISHLFPEVAEPFLDELKVLLLVLWLEWYARSDGRAAAVHFKCPNRGNQHDRIGREAGEPTLKGTQTIFNSSPSFNLL